ncbi:DSS1/SEM1 family-domain-containing protein [Ephemerocybe angulata]|uniref:26S proteasome complex subunit SEM1 n=1 Tax=Ephemerocybe angulata TaxID=980116 RepID=A0A8H6HTM6_9AGAR|nr:DSS1/SEM1 family-domain-containing protein [Tulosesus angulatus]
MSSTTNSKENSKSDASVKPVVVTAASESLGVLEEDDEFEEFAAADWDDAQTDLAHLGGAAPGAAKSAGDKLWEDNWDDDDIEDDFSVQLRSELAKTKGSDAMET